MASNNLLHTIDARNNQKNAEETIIKKNYKTNCETQKSHQCPSLSTKPSSLHLTTTFFPLFAFLIVTNNSIIPLKPVDCALNPVLDINDTLSYLIDPQTGRQIAPKDYMDFENIYAPDENYKRNMTAQARNYHLIKAFDFANYFQSDYWRYTDVEELRKSAEPVANEAICRQQVDWILNQLNTHRGEQILFDPGEQHVNLMTLMDSYGKPDAATFSGHNIWLGSYYECIHVRIDTQIFEREKCLKLHQHQTSGQDCIQDLQKSTSNKGAGGVDATGKMIAGRYCMGKARDKEWPKDDRYKPQITYKIGLCLPEACQTLSINSLQSQLNALMQINLPSFWKSRLNLTDLYCLPDARSPIRKLSPAGYIVLTFIIVWCTLVFVATIIYACYKRNEKRLKKLLIITAALENEGDTDHQHQDLTIKPETSNLNRTLDSIGTNANLLEPSSNGDITIQSTLINNNFTSDHRTKSKSTLSALEQITRSMSSISLNEWLKDSPSIIRILKCMSIVENMVEFREPPLALREIDAGKKLRINLNALDCIKCLCCIFVIFGHIVFIHMQHMTNITHTIELSNQTAPRILISLFNFVDTFFIISGMLTAYFIFKRFNSRTFANPFIWAYIASMRLLRLSPVYILVFWFTKTLTVQLSDGPLWDYATDKNSVKGLCRNDYWWKSLLYLGNWNSMQPLCILPAWSIIVDSQYSIIMPPIIFLLMRYRRFGYVMMVVAVVISTVHMSWQLITQEAVKTSDMAKIRLHVYPLISRFAAEFYNTAFNRIGPVAIGIFGGHALYLYDIGKIRRWPAFMRGLGFKLILLMHLFIMILPTLSKLSEDPTARDNGETDLTIFIMSNATIKPIWSIVNTILLLRLITDLRRHSIIAQLMSHNLWHCMGKLCFISYLIHYEIILVLVKSRQDGLVDPNWSNAGREFSYAFLLSTGISYCVYILYEGPVNNLILIVLDVKGRIAAVNKKDNHLQQASHSNNRKDCQATEMSSAENATDKTKHHQSNGTNKLLLITNINNPTTNNIEIDHLSNNYRNNKENRNLTNNLENNQRESANQTCQLEMQRYQGA